VSKIKNGVQKEHVRVLAVPSDTAALLADQFAGLQRVRQQEPRQTIVPEGQTVGN